MVKGYFVTQPSEAGNLYRGVIVASNKHGEHLVRWHKGYSTWETAASLNLVYAE